MNVTRDAERILALLYAMTDGDPDIVVMCEAIFAEVERLGILDMSDDAFEDWRRSMTERLRVQQGDSG